MSELVQFTTSSGETVLFEASSISPHETEVQRVTSESQIIDGQRLDRALSVVRLVACELVETVRGIDDTADVEPARPGETTINLDQIEAELAIKVGGKGKFIVAEASAEAAITVKLRWARRSA